MGTFVESRIEEGVGYLTLADPDRRNAMTADIVDEALAVLQEFADAGLKVGVLSARGPVFCAGGDLKAKRIPGVPPAGVRLIDAFETSPLLWFAAVEGPALGAALHLLSTCPRVVVSSSAWFAVPEFLHGRFPRPIVAALAEVIGPRRAMRLAMTGERLTAEQALDLGFVESVVEPGQALKTAAEEAMAFAKLNTESLENGRLGWSTRLETRKA
ncbi:enoyl-CoA hydratase/isomerase family protein [Arthrobacter sp. zg-Y1219]|uniref:enoyl-CoA hydratase/isomerase family protein n=1 Tax=Arthrobacter sp. zg-Y1219 TaxID=3049067 RepID=UPI0024C2D38A|nr:enoyl-CoA hydratase/isomerase family protein [Arthrobacter sp. zg-Y1219]MDK1361695.1 enoyl-CoA hydratase/isomerase family protein [Arthrobacter sp. zg-Y1219]